jgi:ribosome-binding factor A
MSKRHERLTQLFLQEITMGLRAVPRLNEDGLLTITGAKLSGDDKTLKVFYSVFGDDPKQTAFKAHLLSVHSRELRTLLFRRLRLKSVPEIIFEYDETPKSAARIEDLLGKLRAEEKPAPREDKNANNDENP